MTNTYYLCFDRFYLWGGPGLEFRQLLYFITLADEKNYTRAASTLHIAQPSLSAAIKKLEQELELSLMDRSSRGFRLTSEGEILYQEAKN